MLPPLTTFVPVLSLQMETVSEADKKEHARKKPAIHKLRALKDVENFLLQRMNHEAFILHRGLHALAE